VYKEKVYCIKLWNNNRFDGTDAEEDARLDFSFNKQTTHTTVERHELFNGALPCFLWSVQTWSRSSWMTSWMTSWTPSCPWMLWEAWILSCSRHASSWMDSSCPYSCSSPTCHVLQLSRCVGRGSFRAPHEVRRYGRKQQQRRMQWQRARWKGKAWSW
jgi:hypothetical protein